MAGSTMVVGLLLIAAYRLGIVPKGNLIDVQTRLACPVKLAVMLLRFRLYSGPPCPRGDAGVGRRRHSIFVAGQLVATVTGGRRPSLMLLILYFSKWWTVGYLISIALAIAAWRAPTTT